MESHVLDVDIHLYKVTKDGVARPHTDSFYGDTVAAHGWNPLAAGELLPEWTVRGCESRAKLHESGDHRKTPLSGPTTAKQIVKATAKKASKK